jgi:hypothetical protein
VAKPRLWGPFDIGASPETVKRTFPEARVQGDAVVLDVNLFSCEFEVELTFDAMGLARVELRLVRTIVSQRFEDVLQRVITGLCVKHGRGEARQRRGDTLRKRWRERWVEIDLLAVNDSRFPVVSVTYNKVSTTDAAFRFL